MNIDKNYFLTRLANGEDMAAIGQEMADLMNAAINEHNAKIEAEKKAEADRLAALAEQEEAKRDLVTEMVEIIQELAILEGMEGEIDINEEDIDQLVVAIHEMFNTLRELKKIQTHFQKMGATPMPSPIISVPVSDDEVLANFIKNLH